MEKSKAYKAKRMKDAALHEKKLQSLDSGFASLLSGLKMKSKSEMWDEAHQQADDYDRCIFNIKIITKLSKLMQFV